MLDAGENEKTAEAPTQQLKRGHFHDEKTDQAKWGNGDESPFIGDVCNLWAMQLLDFMCSKAEHRPSFTICERIEDDDELLEENGTVSTSLVAQFYQKFLRFAQPATEVFLCNEKRRRQMSEKKKDN